MEGNIMKTDKELLGTYECGKNTGEEDRRGFRSGYRTNKRVEVRIQTSKEVEGSFIKTSKNQKLAGKEKTI